MIRDLSLTLRALLRDPTLTSGFPELAATDISFDRPSEAFNPTAATIDLFLFDIRENLELKNNEPLAVRTATGFAISRAPVRVACSYLLTAWPVGGGELALQEHRLLSEALQVLTRFQKIPSAFLQGRLVSQVPALPMLTAKSDGLAEPLEFWTAIGNKLRPSIVVTATIAMDVAAPIVAPEVVTSQLHFGLRSSADDESLAASAGPSMFRIGGRVSAANAAVSGATVRSSMAWSPALTKPGAIRSMPSGATARPRTRRFETIGDRPRAAIPRLRRRRCNHRRPS
jgi:hypothetical protein